MPVMMGHRRGALRGVCLCLVSIERDRDWKGKRRERKEKAGRSKGLRPGEHVCSVWGERRGAENHRGRKPPRGDRGEPEVHPLHLATRPAKNAVVGGRSERMEGPHSSKER